MDIESFLIGKKQGGGSLPLQSKDISITQNGETSVTYDTGYGGLSSVNITTQVGGTPPNWSNIGYSSEPTTVKDVMDNYEDDAYDNALEIKTKIEALGNNDNLKDALTDDLKRDATLYPNVDVSRFTNTSTMMSYLCSDMISLVEFPKLIVSQSIGMLVCMFMNCYNLKKVDLSGINTANANNLGNMFQNCVSLETLDLSTFDTTHITSISYMFDGCKSLTHITFGENFSLANLSTYALMGNMFNNCPNLDNDTLNSIMAVLSTFSGSNTLKRVGFSQDQTNVMKTLSNWSTLQGKGWSTGY